MGTKTTLDIEAVYAVAQATGLTVNTDLDPQFGTEVKIELDGASPALARKALIDYLADNESFGPRALGSSVEVEYGDGTTTVRFTMC